MEVEDILNCFNHSEGRFPIEALHAAQAKPEKITPVLLSVLEHTLFDYKNINDNRMDYIFALYLLSKFREQKAFPFIIGLASLPEPWPEVLLGDCLTEGLASFIVSTFDGDIGSIRRLLENKTVNPWSRGAALKSLLGLVALQKVQRETLVEYLRFLFHSSLSEDKNFVTHLVNISSDLYPEELLDEIQEAFEDDKVDTSVVNLQWVKRVLEKGKKECLETYVYQNRFHLPIEDVEKSMSWMSIFHAKREYMHQNDATVDDEYEWEEDDFSTPYVRSMPKVGRNDACPCGSGQKFKKCCLG